MNDNSHDGSKDFSSDNKSIYANENKVVNDQNERRFRVSIDNVPYLI